MLPQQNVAYVLSSWTHPRCPNKNRTCTLRCQNLQINHFIINLSHAQAWIEEQFLPKYVCQIWASKSHCFPKYVISNEATAKHKNFPSSLKSSVREWISVQPRANQFATMVEKGWKDYRRRMDGSYILRKFKNACGLNLENNNFPSFSGPTKYTSGFYWDIWYAPNWCYHFPYRIARERRL